MIHSFFGLEEIRMFKARPLMKKGESKEYNLARRIEENMEYCIATNRFSDLALYEELLAYIAFRGL